MIFRKNENAENKKCKKFSALLQIRVVIWLYTYWMYEKQCHAYKYG